ncbi:tRNA(m5U54)methyltransferase [Extremus antarcticus]|uniref:Trimethylguanosine synthase n=1 Tax=Extremus antarcticus TaxID=702011 RepID=A0AAJ0DDM8_9PEZI|nr:tRNA(m5U54)methyltransferase [Extremus antarcticus]
MAQKRSFNEGKRHFKKNKKQKKSTTASDGSNEDILLADVRRLLANTRLGTIKNEEEEEKKLPDQFSEVDLEISELSSTGDGLAQKDGQVYVVPFAAPGDTIRAKIYRHVEEESYFLADFVEVLSPSEHRTETPKCPYFTQCSGCQFQHLPYAFQLAHKRRVVEQAYQNFSNLSPKAVPEVGDTIGSPLQYGYRTKLTPHFDGPPGGRRDKRQGKQVTWPEVPPIGYMKKGTKKTMDIEDCPIGTEAVRGGMKRERKRVSDEIDKYQRGATLLLRESTERIKKSDNGQQLNGDGEKPEHDAVLEDRGDYIHRKTCITDSKAISTEYVDSFRFDNPAGAFFQNNNSILPLITQYIRDNILGTSPPTNSTPSRPTKPRIKNLVDAYSGSGFFTITLSSLFQKSIGIDISPQSIASASMNAKLNNLPEGATRFIAADAAKLFESLDVETYKPEETVVVLDPPRKGCDEGFIRQLLGFAPERICYARDVGWLVGGIAGEGKEEGEGKGVDGLYEIESLRGFDFFPQTGHVEGVAILRKKKNGVEDQRADEPAVKVESETAAKTPDPKVEEDVKQQPDAER